MDSKQTVVIGGKKYDAHTGLLMIPQPQAQLLRQSKHVVASTSVHTPLQRSKTLKRAIVKKIVQSNSGVRRSVDVIRKKKTIQKSPHITRFAPHPTVQQPHKISSQDIVAAKHPSLARAHQSQKKQTTPSLVHSAPSHVLKQQVVNSALTATTHRPGQTKLSLKKRFPRLFSVASASFAVLILGAYVTYLNLPTISIHVAAAHAGIDASYPDYRPDGYRLSGLIASSDGEVSMKFAANAGPQNFTIKETKSSWDSTAVLENYVKPKTAGEYVTYNENGLTIYTYDNNAAWVNGGILYKIDGDAPLSNEQIRRIATSL